VGDERRKKKSAFLSFSGKGTIKSRSFSSELVVIL